MLGLAIIEGFFVLGAGRSLLAEYVVGAVNHRRASRGIDAAASHAFLAPAELALVAADASLDPPSSWTVPVLFYGFGVWVPSSLRLPRHLPAETSSATA